MKVFLSWSGERSKAAATALHAWLPTVIQTVRTYMSAENIDKGERWSIDISKQLEETHFGVICITPENIEAPWVLFEAGALSKSMEKARVSPLLFEIGPSDFTNSPLLQFQLTVFKKDDFSRLLHSMNAAAPDSEKLSVEVLNRSFERAWVELESEIAKIDFSLKRPMGKPAKDEKPDNKLEAVLDELLTIARSQIRLLRSPEDILPPDYLLHALDRARLITPNMSHRHPAWNDLEISIQKCVEEVDKSSLPTETKANLLNRLENGQGALRYIKDRLYREGRSRRLPRASNEISVIEHETAPDGHPL